MGGYIVVIDQDEGLAMYGLTAGHTIVQDVLEEEVQSEQAYKEPDIEGSLFPDLAITAPSQVPKAVASRAMNNTTYKLATHSQELVEWSGTARVAPVSFSPQACDRDWAILEAIAGQPGCGNQDDQPFERYLLGDPRSGAVLRDDRMEMSLQPPFIGKLSRLPSYALLSYGSDFVCVHTITMRNASGKSRNLIPSIKLTHHRDTSRHFGYVGIHGNDGTSE